ncbi:MAG: hypothetical protein JXQ73_23455 [Phycisphaerae bacterium]|nr:hypothetical protein [Phycisphaerae bacterium]
MAKQRRSKRKPLPDLAFKDFFTFAQTERFLHGLAQARPDLCRLETIGYSRQGRPLYMLTITEFATGPSRDKPAYLVHGNIHATELAGTHASLMTARQLLADHGPRGRGLLSRVVFHIVPRINPDGAEFAMTTSGAIRSRTERRPLTPNTLYQEDVNADGLILTMRQKHPDGPFVKDPGDARLMIRRRGDSKPPFYRLLPEGLIFQWDGSDGIRVEGRGFDWNRNWSYDWRPEPEQGGAGDFPFSEPEMRALGKWIHARPNLFAVLGYHTGPNAILMPPSTGSLSDLDADDLRQIQDIGEIGAKHTGFPAIHVINYRFERDPTNNLRGHFHNFGYQHLGLFVYEFELGTMYNTPGISTKEIFACRKRQDEEGVIRRIMKWCDRNPRRAPKLFRSWRRFRHPQLGDVEIGGLLRKYLYNPTPAELATIARNTYKFTIDHAAKHPWLRIEDLTVEQVSAGVHRIRARVANRGELPTNVTNQGKSLARLHPVRVEFHAGEGAEVLSRQAHHELGHLEGLTGGQLMEWFVAAPPEGAVCTIHVRGGTGGNVTEVIEL